MSEPYVIKMPQLSDTMTEGVVVSWEKNIGDEIKRGDIVATVETDKAVMDVEVFRDGFLSGPIAAIDSVVAVTHPIAYLVDSRDEVNDSQAEQSAAPAAGVAPVATAPAAAVPACAIGCRGCCSHTATAGHQGLATGTQAGGTAGYRYRSNQWFRPGWCGNRE